MTDTTQEIFQTRPRGVKNMDKPEEAPSYMGKGRRKGLETEITANGGQCVVNLCKPW